MKVFLSGVKKFFGIENEFDSIMRNCIYFLLMMDFLILIFPFLNIVSLKGTIQVDTPDSDIFQHLVVILKDLHLFILGSFTFKKIGKYAVQGVVAIACARAGVDPQKSLEAINYHGETNGSIVNNQVVSQEVK